MEPKTLSKEAIDFFKDLDSQHLKFSTYLLAVCGRFRCSPQEAAKLIVQYMKEV